MVGAVGRITKIMASAMGNEEVNGRMTSACWYQATGEPGSIRRAGEKHQQKMGRCGGVGRVSAMGNGGVINGWESEEYSSGREDKS